MGQMDALRRTWFLAPVQEERFSYHKVCSIGGEFTDPQLRPLQIHQNADRASGVGLDFADNTKKFGQPLMGGMAHIYAKHISARFEQASDCFSI
jgi:hypothetical protein